MKLPIVKILCFHSFKALHSTLFRLHHRLPKSFNADAISSLHICNDIFFLSTLSGKLQRARSWEVFTADRRRSCALVQWTGAVWPVRCRAFGCRLSLIYSCEPTSLLYFGQSPSVDGGVPDCRVCPLWSC